MVQTANLPTEVPDDPEEPPRLSCPDDADWSNCLEPPAERRQPSRPREKRRIRVAAPRVRARMGFPEGQHLQPDRPDPESGQSARVGPNPDSKSN